MNQRNQLKAEKSLQTAIEKITDSNAPLRKRLADAYNFGLIHLSEFDFIEDDKRQRFAKVSAKLQASDPGNMPTRAERSAELLTLDEATEIASEILNLAR